MPTGISWVDAAVERANLPPMADLEGGLLIYNQVACDNVSTHTFRRYAIPYKLVGRTRRYIVDDIIAFARKRLEESPVRKPAPAASRPALALKQPKPVAADWRAAPGMRLGPLGTVRL
jgi:hypothetical protein